MAAYGALQGSSQAGCVAVTTELHYRRDSRRGLCGRSISREVLQERQPVGLPYRCGSLWCEGLRCSDGNDVVAFEEAALQVWQSGDHTDHTVTVHYTAIVATQRQHQWVRSRRLRCRCSSRWGFDGRS